PYNSYFVASQTITGRSTAKITSNPGGDKYGLYQGSFFIFDFFTSARNQLPRIPAAARTATALIIPKTVKTLPRFIFYYIDRPNSSQEKHLALPDAPTQKLFHVKQLTA
ncbi:MAG: hypothetical protein ACLFNW_05025, partial [Desulfobacterales bacterium]